MTWAKKTLVTSFKYKIVVGDLQTFTKHILSSKNTSQGLPMAEFSPLEVLAWIKSFNPSFKDALVPLSSLASFPITKSKWMNLLFVLLPTFRFLLVMFSTSMVWKYALLLKSLVQSLANLMLALSSFPSLARILLT